MLPSNRKDGKFSLQPAPPTLEEPPTSEEPTDEELATMIMLGTQQMQLREKSESFLWLLHSLRKDFMDAHDEENFFGKKSNCQHVGHMRTSDACVCEAPEDKDQNQSAAAKSVGKVQDSLAHMPKSIGSENSKYVDMPPHFESLTLPFDLQPGIRVKAVHLEPCNKNVDVLQDTSGMTVAENSAAVGEALASGVACTAQSSGSNSAVASCSAASSGEFPEATEPTLMARPPGNINSNQFNSLLLGSSSCVPTQSHAQKSASTDPQASCSGMESLTAPSPRNSLMNGTFSSTDSSGSNQVVAQNHMEVRICSQGHNGKPRNSSRDLNETTETQVECNVAVAETLQSPQRTATQGTFSETAVSVSNTSVDLKFITGESTTLLVRNIPARCTKEVLLQKWPPDGTYDFLYLPFSFNQKRISGFAFVNFTSHAAATAFHSQWHGKWLFSEGYSAKLKVSAASIQGLEENVRYLFHCKIGRIKNPMLLPSVFEGLQEVPFSEYIQKLGLSSECQSVEQNVQLPTQADVSPDAL